MLDCRSANLPEKMLRTLAQYGAYEVNISNLATIQLEGDFYGALEKARGAGALGVAEAGARRIARTRVIEVWMIQHIECLKPEIEIEAFMNGKDARYLGIELIGRNAPVCVSTGVSKCPGVRIQSERRRI